MTESQVQRPRPPGQEQALQRAAAQEQVPDPGLLPSRPVSTLSNGKSGACMAGTTVVLEVVSGDEVRGVLVPL